MIYVKMPDGKEKIAFKAYGTLHFVRVQPYERVIQTPIPHYSTPQQVKYEPKAVNVEAKRLAVAEEAKALKPLVRIVPVQKRSLAIERMVSERKEAKKPIKISRQRYEELLNETPKHYRKDVIQKWAGRIEQ